MGVVDRACRWWVTAVVRRAGLTLALAGVATVAVAAYAALNLGIDTDTRKLINPALGFQERQRELARVFHSLADGILVVIDADSPTAAGRAADDLAARLAPRTDLFSAIDVPGGGPFFAKNALLYLTTDQLEDLTDRLSKVQPFLAEIARDQSLVGVADLLRQALKAAAGRKRHRLRPRGGARSRDGGRRSRGRRQARHRPVGQRAVRRRRRRRSAPACGRASPGKHDDGMLARGAPELEAIDNARRDLGLTRDRGFRVRVTGEPVMNYEELGAVAKQSRFVAIISFVLFSATIIFALRASASGGRGLRQPRREPALEQRRRGGDRRRSQHDLGRLQRAHRRARRRVRDPFRHALHGVRRARP